MTFSINKKKGQNIIEVVLIIPLLVVILLGVLEYALFQRNVNAVQDIAEEASAAASKYYVDEEICDESSPPLWCADGAAYDATENAAAQAARTLVENRLKSLGFETITWDFNDLGPAFGKRPFALYEFNSMQQADYDGETVPIITLTVDYRDPVAEGVSVQLIYHYSLVLFGVEFRIPGINNGRKITIIPRNVKLSSTQTKQYVHY